MALIVWTGFCGSIGRGGSDAVATQFEQLERLDWQVQMEDPGTGDWRDRWFLDGLKARVTNDERGMHFAAGSTHRHNPDHAVLWTREPFHGDVRIDFEYTKTDDEIRNVNIIYLLATGQGEAPYVEDIFTWRDLRAEPAMRMYFDHMQTYHVSFAAFAMENDDPEADYIRARRYQPDKGKGLSGTALQPDYEPTGLFKTGVPHRITVIKHGDHLFMRVQNDAQTMICHWPTDTHPDLTSGRIGLRHMFTRSARYRNFQVSNLD